MNITCPICNDDVGLCICRMRADNDNFNGDIIRLPSDAQLRRPSSVQRLAIAYGAMGYSRRRIVDQLADLIYLTDPVVIDASGRRIIFDDEVIERVFRTEMDGSLRWISDWLSFQHRAPVKGAQVRTLERYKLLWIGLALAYPNMAAAVVR